MSEVFSILLRQHIRTERSDRVIQVYTTQFVDVGFFFLSLHCKLVIGFFFFSRNLKRQSLKRLFETRMSNQRNPRETVYVSLQSAFS